MTQPSFNAASFTATNRSCRNPGPKSDPNSAATIPVPIVISQRHLSLFEQCPRRYQAEILDRRSLPISDPQRRALQRGQQFHHLLQQRALGIVGQIHDPQLDRWLDRWQQTASLQPHADPSQYYLAEHTRTLALPPFELLVRYDALIADRDRADILDWKTYARPKHPQKLANNWQTRLYRYVLAATSDYPPERIAMVYWFAEPAQSEAEITNDVNDQGRRDKTGGDRVTLAYDLEQFKQDHHEITHLLDRLTTAREAAASSSRGLFPTRHELGQPCGPQECACLQLQLLDEGKSEPTIAVRDLSEIAEIAP